MIFSMILFRCTIALILALCSISIEEFALSLLFLTAMDCSALISIFRSLGYVVFHCSDLKSHFRSQCSSTHSKITSRIMMISSLAVGEEWETQIRTAT